MNRRCRRSSESGFTLPEILMAVTILAIIVVPLGESMLVGLRSSDRTATVLATSADRQLLSVYFPPDVDSASTLDTTDAGARCNGDAGSRVVRLEWHEFDAVTPVTTYVADYRLVTVGTGRELVRFGCVLGGTASRLAVAHHVAPTVTPAVTVSGENVAVTLTDTLGTRYTVSGSRRTP